MQEGQRFHYTLLFYCPVNSEPYCSTLRVVSANEEETSQVNVDVKPFEPLESNITSTFVGHIPSIPERILASEARRMSEAPPKFISTDDIECPFSQPPESNAPQPVIGVCNVLPYRSSIRKKRAVHVAILRDWIRYYSELGMTIFLYDRHGDRYRDYMATSPNLHYFGYTIGEYAIPNAKYQEYDKDGYDNAATNLSMHRFIYDDDKVMTLTHCRFEARAKYGIERVVVVDTDEFMLCGSPRTLGEARRNIDRIADTYSAAGHTEISFQQRVPCSRNVLGQGSGLLNCAMAATKKNASVLKCFTSSDCCMDEHSHKTLFLGFFCPYTSYHQGCSVPRDGQEPFYGLCQGCRRELEFRHCKFIHISLRNDTFTLERYLDNCGSPPMKFYHTLSSQCEVQELLYSKKRVHDKVISLG